MADAVAWKNELGKIHWQPKQSNDSRLWLDFYDGKKWQIEEYSRSFPKLYKSKKRAIRTAKKAEKRRMGDTWHKVDE